MEYGVIIGQARPDTYEFNIAEPGATSGRWKPDGEAEVW